MSQPQSLSICLWFDHQAEEAVSLYTGLIANSRIRHISRYGANAPLPQGTAMMVKFELGGAPFSAMNGGPHYKLTEAASIVVNCDSQAEIDRLWDALSGEGAKEMRCGWLTDRFGLTWQILPAALPDWMSGPTAGRVMSAFMGMKRPDIAALETAHRGE